MNAKTLPALGDVVVLSSSPTCYVVKMWDWCDCRCNCCRRHLEHHASWRTVGIASTKDDADRIAQEWRERGERRRRADVAT